MSCQLCETTVGDNQLVGLSSKDELETFKFFKGSLAAKGTAVCQPCSFKIQFVSKVKSGTAPIESFVQPVKTETNYHEEVEEDVDLEELDQLSIFYAEQDDLDKDPDFAPKQKPKKPKKLPTESIKCQLCNYSFSSAVVLEQHFKDCHNYDVKHEPSDETQTCGCKGCGGQFSSQNELMRHILNASCFPTKEHETKPLECEVCQRSFRRLSSLKSHEKRCKLDFKSNGECDVCKKTILPGRMAAHYAFEHICRQCSSFPSNDNQQVFLNRREKCKHLKEIHNMQKKSAKPKVNKVVNTDPKRFQCSECIASFKTADSLRVHGKNKHNREDRMLKCPFCDYKVGQWRRYALYSSHIPSVHPGQALDVIQDRISRREAWKIDYAARSKVQCILCDYASSKGSHLKRHYRDVHDYDFTAIQNAPDPEDPDGALCPECGQHFTNKRVLVHHMLKCHSVPKGEQCSYCDFRYVDVAEHVARWHSNEVSIKSHSCQFCPQSFKYSKNLKIHVKNCHNKKHQKGEEEKKSENAGNSDTRIQNHDDESNDGMLIKPKKKYVPVHLAGICPYCEFKFADLLGHIRHNHDADKNKELNPTALECQLCQEAFKSVRELVTHRQLHPQFANHVCGKCSSEFETVVELRNHRINLCPKKRKRVKKPVDKPAPSTDESDKERSEDHHPLSTLMQMAKELDGNLGGSVTVEKPKQVIDNEGRGTVACYLCDKSYLKKSKLKQHYIASHDYDPKLTSEQPLPGKEHNCSECEENCGNWHARIKHQLDVHSRISGNICPYCDNKWSWRKYDDLDSHVRKYHSSKMNSTTQVCRSCKAPFDSYEGLKRHRQLHESGNRIRLVQITPTGQNDAVSVNVKVASRKEIENRGGVKCQLCSVFKMRKDQLKVHYEKYHGYQPKLAVDKKAKAAAESMLDEDSLLGVDDFPFVCPTCLETFKDNNFLIKHLLKDHCVYSGLICPYCTGHHPKRYVDLQSHVTSDHMDKLTGYDVSNVCKVCKTQFQGYAELRDHVQQHGDMFREPSANVERYKETARMKRQALKQNKRLKRFVQVPPPVPVLEEPPKPPKEDPKIDLEETDNAVEDTIVKPNFPDPGESDRAQMMGGEDVDPPLGIPMTTGPMEEEEEEEVEEEVEEEEQEDSEDEGQQGVIVVTPAVATTSSAFHFKVPEIFTGNSSNQLIYSTTDCFQLPTIIAKPQPTYPDPPRIFTEVVTVAPPPPAPLPVPVPLPPPPVVPPPPTIIPVSLPHSAPLPVVPLLPVQPPQLQPQLQPELQPEQPEEPAMKPIEDEEVREDDVAPKTPASQTDFHSISSPFFSVAALLAAAELDQDCLSVKSSNFNESVLLQTPEPPTPNMSEYDPRSPR